MEVFSCIHITFKYETMKTCARLSDIPEKQRKAQLSTSCEVQQHGKVCSEVLPDKLQLCFLR